MSGANSGVQGLINPTDLTKVTIDTVTNVTGDQIVVTGAPAQTIRVHTMFLSLGNGTDISFRSGATSLGTLQSASTLAFDFRDRPIFQCGDGENFIINLAQSRRLTGWLEYVRN